MAGRTAYAAANTPPVNNGYPILARADFDLVGRAQAGFKVQAGDVVKVFIMDDLTNDINHNAILLQQRPQ